MTYSMSRSEHAVHGTPLHGLDMDLMHRLQGDFFDQKFYATFFLAADAQEPGAGSKLAAGRGSTQGTLAQLEQ